MECPLTMMSKQCQPARAAWWSRRTEAALAEAARVPWFLYERPDASPAEVSNGSFLPGRPGSRTRLSRGGSVP